MLHLATISPFPDRDPYTGMMEKVYVSKLLQFYFNFNFSFWQKLKFFFFLDNENYEEYGLVEFQLTAVNLTSQVKHWKTPLVPKLGSIKILGFMKPINKVTFNGKKCEFTYNATALVSLFKNKYLFVKLRQNIIRDLYFQVLTVDQLNEDLNKSFVLSWSI